MNRATLEVVDGIAHLRLVRAPNNAIDKAMTEELRDAVDELQNRHDVRAVLIGADGRDLSVGGDLPALAASGDGVGDLLDEMIGTYHRTLTAIADLPIPVVCAFRGAAAGGGLGLLWASDVVVAASDARLVLAFSALGLSGDGGSSWYLPRLVGLRQALDLVMQGKVLGAQEAVDLGLITSVVAPDEVEATAEAAARQLAAGPTAALGAMRRLYRQGLHRDLVGQFAAEQEAIVRLALTDDGREGIRAFTERRRPDFRGK